MPWKPFKHRKRYFTIGELAKELGIAQSMIRHWESEVPSLEPKKRKKYKGTHKQRVYSIKEKEKVVRFHNLVKVQGYTLRGARLQLNKRG